MPARDQSGPMGEGPMTGRAAGICNENQPAENFIGRPFNRLHRFWKFGGGRFGGGRGFGRGAGRGYGIRGSWGDSGVPADFNQEKVLQQRKQWLEQELDQINQQLKAE